MLHMLVAACCLITGSVHTPAGAAIAQAGLLFSGPKTLRTRSDAKGTFSVSLPPGRYDLTASASGYATVTVNTGELNRDSNLDVVLEPVNSPKLRTIGTVTVNGGYTLQRDVVPSTDVSRSEMDALGYTNIVQGLQQVPSVVIQHPDAGSPTAPAVASLRGPDPSEAMVTLDGQLLNDGNTGDLDLSQFGVPAFNSVNVTEGLGPADLEGSNTFGGAVNFVSLLPTQADHAALSGSIGSYGTTQMWLNATGTVGRLGYALAADDFNQAGQVNQTALVYPYGNTPAYCGPPKKNVTENCPAFVRLGSSIAAREGLLNLDYNFSQRADAGIRLFTLGNSRDESSALDGIDGNALCSNANGPTSLPPCSTTSSEAAASNPQFGQHVGPGGATLAQSIRAYRAYSRSVLGAGQLTANLYADDDNDDFSGASLSPTNLTPYDVSHLDRRYNESLSWGRTFDEGQFAFGGYTQQESLTGVGITQTLAQRSNGYFVRGGQEIGRLHLSAGIYDASYSTFGNSVDWRLGASYDLGSDTSVNASAGTGFRAPLLIERYYFSPVVGKDGKLHPNPGLPPADQNCVVAGQGNPLENPEHATAYEFGISHVFTSLSKIDVSFYRSNLRDTIENYYPGGGAQNFCGKNSPNGFVYEIPINIGNAVYEGAEARFTQRFAEQHLTTVLSYGLNIAYPYALGPNVSNPTSGGTLVDNDQFLGVPQQQGAATLIWANQGWHVSSAFTFYGRNNSLNQGPYTLSDAAVGKTFGAFDVTVAGTNVFNAVSGEFTRYGVGVPYNGLVRSNILGNLPTDRLFVQPAAVHFILTVRQ